MHPDGRKIAKAAVIVLAIAGTAWLAIELTRFLTLVFAAAIFLASDLATYRRGFLLPMPRAAEPAIADTLDRAGQGLRGWMIGQAVSSLFVGSLTWIGLGKRLDRSDHDDR